MLDYGYCGGRKISGGSPCGVGIQDIVKGKLFAPGLLCPGNAGVLPVPYPVFSIENCRLMGIFTVTQVIALGKGYGHILGEALFSLPEILGDSSIVHSYMLKGLLGKLLAFI